MSEVAQPPAAPAGPSGCARCRKPAGLCVCDGVAAIDAGTFVLILQHPQEQDRELGSAWLAHLQLRNSRVVVGLSWKGLGAILGRRVDPHRWGVLYLGSAKPAATAERGGERRRPLTVMTGRGVPLPGQEAALAGLEGIILLDGNWSQAKALWWRNPWLLKLRRLVLAPDFRSLYGNLRREPRADSVSTIEAAALCLAVLAGDPSLLPRILRPFALLLTRYKENRRVLARS